MKIFKNIFGKEELDEYLDKDILAVCTGELISPDRIDDPAFSEQMLGKTVGIIPEDSKFVSPCNGVLEVLFPTGHAYGVRAKDGTSILVHIGIDTVDMHGIGFHVHKAQGDIVQAGEVIVSVDLEVIKNAGYDITTSVIITEEADNREYNLVELGHIEKGKTLYK